MGPHSNQKGGGTEARGDQPTAATAKYQQARSLHRTCPENHPRTTGGGNSYVRPTEWGRPYQHAQGPHIPLNVSLCSPPPASRRASLPLFLLPFTVNSECSSQLHYAHCRWRQSLVSVSREGKMTVEMASPEAQARRRTAAALRIMRARTFKRWNVQPPNTAPLACAPVHHGARSRSPHTHARAHTQPVGTRTVNVPCRRRLPHRWTCSPKDSRRWRWPQGLLLFSGALSLSAPGKMREQRPATSQPS
jgi:hypothetical protein